MSWVLSEKQHHRPRNMMGNMDSVSSPGLRWRGYLRGGGGGAGGREVFALTFFTYYNKAYIL